MYCPKCGKELNDEVKFCSNCGYKIKKDTNEETKEINIGVIKEVEQNPNFNKKEVKIKENNNNIIVISLCTIIILLLIMALLLINNNKKSYLFEEEKELYCNENKEICTKEEKEEEIPTYFESMDFTEYDFSVSTSKQDFYDSVVGILNTKSEAGHKYCNNPRYVNASNQINNNLNLDYSYLCGIDVNYIDNLILRLNKFYYQNNIKDKIVDAYVVGKGGRNEYANYTGQTIGSNNNYMAYLRRVHMSINLFSDYDKLKKTYESDLQAGFHPKNSTPEDIIVHETAHALDFYISAEKYGVDNLVIDDFKKYNEFYISWANQTYSKEVVLKAVENVNNSYKENGLTPKKEEELKEEISGYANIVNNGTVMYAETFAEALVDYLSNGNNASPLSIEIYKIVQEDLKNL